MDLNIPRAVPAYFNIGRGQELFYFVSDIGMRHAIRLTTLRGSSARGKVFRMGNSLKDKLRNFSYQLQPSCYPKPAYEAEL